jgi:hypothetical protein
MKQTLKFWSLATLVVLSVGFSSCSKDDDESNDNALLIGKWEAVADYLKEGSSWKLDYNYHAGECIWTFDGTHVVVQEKNNLMNEEKVVYSYNDSKKELTALGFTSKVLKLTQTELELESFLMIVGEDTTFPMKKTFKKIQ